MKKPHRLGEISLAIAAVISATALAGTANAGKAAGKYLTGDFHNHTTCSDGTLSLQKLVDKSVGTYGLDWFTQVGHGGSSARNCTLAEDPFEPVPPGLNLPASSTGPWPPNTYPSGGQPAAALKGPNQSWESTLPNGRAGIKGDGSATPKAMWKWQEIQEFMYPVAERESRLRDKPVFMGLEQVVPGHEHTSSTIISGQLPATGAGNANALAQWEYCFDRADTDTSRGAENQWDCSVPGSPNNSLINATARKITGAGNTGTAGHLKTVEGIKWMAAYHPETSYYIPAHVERAGVFNPNGNNGFNIEHFRDFNNAAPRIAFGFESMPGHQPSGSRGGYGTSAAGGGTYGGTGAYAAIVGGVWDALLAEGRDWWFFASSDYHNRGSFGPDQRESTGDFYPGEYTRDHVMVRHGAGKPTAQAVVDGLRSGNSFVANGGLIDRMAFVACASYRGIGYRSNAVVEQLAAHAAASNTDTDVPGCATMGERLEVRPGAEIVVAVVLRDPQGKNLSPYSFANPSLKQIGLTQPLDMPVLDHVDVIGGTVTGRVAPTSTGYAGEIGSAAASNPSAAIRKVFNSTNWTALPDGTRKMSYRFPAAEASQYLRLRGSNLPPATPFETDADGNPLLDFGMVKKIACNDAMCPAHMDLVNGVKYTNTDVAAWADLWFYSNPIYVMVQNRARVIVNR